MVIEQFWMALKTSKGIWRWQNSVNIFSPQPGKKIVHPFTSVAKLMSTGAVREVQENILGTALSRSSSSVKVDVGNGVEELKLVLEEADNHLHKIGYYEEKDKSYGNTAMLESLFKRHSQVILDCLRKLQGSRHPIVSIAGDLCSFSGTGRSMLQEGTGETTWAWCQTRERITLSMILSSVSLQLRAVIILLVSSIIHGIGKDGDFLMNLEASRLDTVVPKLKNNPSHNLNLQVKKKHRKLAEITEMIFAAYSIHQTVVTLPKSPQDVTSLLKHGNNLSVLMGDLLLAKSSRALADLCNAEVTEFMSNAIADFAESQFLVMAANGGRVGNKSLKLYASNRFSKYSKDGTTAWATRHSLGLGSLLGNACVCSAIISGADVSFREFAYKLGESLALVLQAAIEISQVQTGASISSHGNGSGAKMKDVPYFQNVEICSLPLVEALDCNLISETDLRNVRLDSAEYYKLCREITNRNLGMKVFRILQDDTLRTLRYIDGTSAALLTRIIESLTPVLSE